MNIHSPAMISIVNAENLTSPRGNQFTKPIHEFNNSVKI